MHFISQLIPLKNWTPYTMDNKTESEKIKVPKTISCLFLLFVVCLIHYKKTSIHPAHISQSAYTAAALNVSVQMFYVRHRTECLQEAGTGTGDRFQRNSGVSGRWREAAAQGTRFQLWVSLLMTASYSEGHRRAIMQWFQSTVCLPLKPIRKSYIRDTICLKYQTGKRCVLSLFLLHRW